MSGPEEDFRPICQQSSAETFVIACLRSLRREQDEADRDRVRLDEKITQLVLRVAELETVLDRMRQEPDE